MSHILEHKQLGCFVVSFHECFVAEPGLIGPALGTNREMCAMILEEMGLQLAVPHLTPVQQ